MGKMNIVILGAGYGGIMTAVKLEKMLSGHDAAITLVNKDDYHYQTAWLHEKAAGTLHHDRMRVPVKDIINMQKTHFILDTVVSIKPDEKKVKLADGDLQYDILVIGLGFDIVESEIPGLKENAFTIDNINNARLIKEHVEYNFAMYLHEDTKNQGRLNIVVGGGGFTEIEFLGELANRIPELCEEYDINKTMVRIINIEQSPIVLSDFDQQLAEYAMNSLESRGVEFVTSAMLKECKPDRIIFEKDGKVEEIPTYTTVWFSGVRANSIVEKAGFSLKQKRVNVRQDMRAPGYDDVFVIGDCAMIEDKKSGKVCAPTAQMAIQASETVANNIKALIAGAELKSFEPQFFGTVASLGNTDAIGRTLSNRKLFGWKAVLMKMIIDNRYLFKLGGLNLLMRNGKFNIFSND